MNKINKVVTKNYQLPEFNVHQLAENMNMSRTSFYRKFMNIADSSPKDYITNFRINKSIELIHTGYESFGEISCMCGFSSQSIFSIAFKKVKGVSPLQYKRSIVQVKDKEKNGQISNHVNH
jgi:AraC-like DNA-binding protein